MTYIEINGTEYPVRYSLRALKKFELQTKKSVFTLSDATKMTAEDCLWLIYVGIADGAAFEGDKFELKLKDIEGHVHLSHVEECVAALQEHTGAGKKKR